jgi:hypothetical protein
MDKNKEEYKMGDTYANTPRTERPVKVNCDEEAWVLAIMRYLVRTTTEINKISTPSAFNHITEQAVNGAIHGASLAVLYNLGLDPANVNIKTRSV